MRRLFVASMMKRRLSFGPKPWSRCCVIIALNVVSNNGEKLENGLFVVWRELSKVTSNSVPLLKPCSYLMLLVKVLPVELGEKELVPGVVERSNSLVPVITGSKL